MAESGSFMICKNDLSVHFRWMFSCTLLLLTGALLCLFVRRIWNTPVSLQSVIFLNICISWTSAWDHSPLLRPPGHLHHKHSCGSAHSKLIPGARNSSWATVMSQGHQMVGLMYKSTTSAIGLSESLCF